MHFSRRRALQTILAVGATAGDGVCWNSRVGAALRAAGERRQLLVLWMPGGPSQLDTFDLKPGHAHGGPFQEIATCVPGLRFSEHLPKLANWANHLAVVRSMQTKEGDHSRGTFWVRTGHRPGSPVRVPALPASLAQQLTTGDTEIPDYVSILPSTAIQPAAFSAGFLGAAAEPLTVGYVGSEPGLGSAASSPSADEPVDLRVDHLLPPADVDALRLQRRQAYWNLLQQSYGASQRGGAAATHDVVYRRAMQLAESRLASAFDLRRESDTARRAYGVTAFGQGCLMARRLLEYGVPVVEVALSRANNGLAWDSHTNNFDIVRRLSEELDVAWSQLLSELEQRGLLATTTIVWLGEFGRTPEINSNGGRDHFPDAWSCVLGGAGIAGGAIVGKTSSDGKEIVDRPVTVPELLATISCAVRVDPQHENISDQRRPIKIADAQPVAELLS